MIDHTTVLLHSPFNTLLVIKKNVLFHFLNSNLMQIFFSPDLLAKKASKDSSRQMKVCLRYKQKLFLFYFSMS